MVDLRVVVLGVLVIGVMWLVRPRPAWNAPILAAMAVGALFVMIVFGYPNLVSL